MKCPECKGLRRVIIHPVDEVVYKVPMIMPCPACNGSGEAYCCEGGTAADLPCDTERKD